MPKKSKHRKQFRGRMTGVAYRGSKIDYGEFAIVSLEPSWIKSNQIEAARIAITRFIKRGGQVWIKIFPDKPATKKAAGTRMGSGKGSPEFWVAVVKPGRVMFELGGVSENIAREALRLAIHKLPLKCKIISKNDLENNNLKNDLEDIKTTKIS
jgi:large subunit ribosomal protein L16